MSPLWSKCLELLEALGRMRLPLWRGRTEVTVGNPDAVDAGGDLGWREFTRAEPLFDVWGPVPGSPWEPFHCVTLFAALERIPGNRVGPAAPPAAFDPFAGRVPPPAWAAPDVWTMVDLAGPRSVAIAAWLCAELGLQPVCTFDNWPNPAGLIQPERVLAALLYYAIVLEAARPGLAASSPPVWVCDRERLGTRTGRPKEFDNRYFLDDSLLPGPEILRSAGIRNVVYLVEDEHDPEVADLSAYFTLLRQQGFGLFRAALGLQGLEQLQPLEPAGRTFRPSGFFRSTAGGFGAPIPEPSSSSG